MKRREFLGLAALPLAQALNQQPLRSLRGRVIGIEGAEAAGVQLITTWLGSYCRPRITNRTSRAIRVKEVVVFDVELSLVETGSVVDVAESDPPTTEPVVRSPLARSVCAALPEKVPLPEAIRSACIRQSDMVIK